MHICVYPKVLTSESRLGECRKAVPNARDLQRPQFQVFQLSSNIGLARDQYYVSPKSSKTSKSALAPLYSPIPPASSAFGFPVGDVSEGGLEPSSWVDELYDLFQVLFISQEVL